MFMNTFDKVAKMIAEQLNIPVSEVTGDKEVVKDLGADSLDIVELVMTLEDETGIKIDEDKASGIKTVNDIVALIDEAK